MTQPAAPVSSLPSWRLHDDTRHWHLYIQEVTHDINSHTKPPPADVDRPEDAVAHTPDEVLGWLRTQVERARPRAVGRYAARLDEHLDALADHRRGPLTRGRGAGATLRLTDGLMVTMYAMSAGQDEQLPDGVVLDVDEACTRTHRR